MERSAVETKNGGILQAMVEKYQRRVDRLKAQSGGGLASTIMAYEVMRDYYLAGTRAKEEGRTIACYDGYGAHEILFSMDVYPLNMEFLAYHMVKDTRKYVDVASEYGFATDMCTSTRMECGIAIAEDLPRPDFVVTSALTCDSCYKSCTFFSHHYDIPIFPLDCPYTINEESIRYYAGEHRKLIEFIEGITGRKFELERLMDVEERGRKIYNYFREIQELRKAVPSPMRARDSLRNIGIAILSGYSPKTVEYFRSTLDEVKERANRKQGVVEDEKYRLLWLQTAPLFTDFFKVLEEEYGAVVVFDELSDVYWDDQYTSDPLYNIARRGMMNPWWGEMSQRRTKSIVEKARDYKVDGCIHFIPWGCRVSSNAYGVIKDNLMKELGVPTLSLDSCYMDPNLFVLPQVKAKVEAFLEMIDK